MATMLVEAKFFSVFNFPSPFKSVHAYKSILQIPALLARVMQYQLVAENFLEVL